MLLITIYYFYQKTFLNLKNKFFSRIEIAQTAQNMMND